MKIEHHTHPAWRRQDIWRGNRCRHFVLWLAMLCGWCSVYAQTYPVYVTPSLMPPYSLKLSDYSAVGSQQLVATIMVNDIHISNLPVKLHIKIEGSGGVTVETSPTLTTLPVYLNGGQATLLFGADLADYFNLDNLVFTGYSKEQYRRTGYLPEGFYKFTVEILHYGTNRLISNRGMATAWMALGKPPALRSPDDGAELGQVAGMPLTFSWLPSNVGIPTAGVHYTFELWELRIPGINPNVIAASMPALHSVQQAHTALVVQPAELFLEQGMRYAWRVTAFDPMGRVPFEQEGHSAVRTFTYQARCDTVTNFVAERQAAQGTFRWDVGVNHTSFNVEMRNPATSYFRQSQTFDNQVTYPGLELGTTYQLRVQAVCNGDPQHVSAYSAWRTLSIPELKKDSTSCPDCRCGESPQPPPITNFTLRKDLQPGDVISNAAGSTRFVLKTVVPQANGVYRGLFWFWAEIWNLKILCEYWDLSVNTDNVMVKVDYESVYNPQFLLDADAAKEYIDHLADAIAEVTTNTNIRDTVRLDVPVKGVYTDGDGRLVVVTENPDGSLTETPLQVDGELNRTLIQGADGEEYVVTSGGQVMGVEEFEQTGGNGRLMDNYKEEKEATRTAAHPSVTFSAADNQKYGFDAYSDIKTNIQNEYPELKAGYRLAFKSVASYAADKVRASVPEPDVTFRNEMGVRPLSSGNELTVRGGAGGSEVALYAYQRSDSTEEIVGKLNIMSFDEQVKKLYVVSVNGAALPDVAALRDALNRIYAQAVVRWEVAEGKKVNVTFPDGKMTHGGSGIGKVYNADQKKALEAYGEVEKEALYLFFVKEVQGKEGVQGYMPLQYQYGFIYDNPGATIIAHELAHGAFNLWHTFSSEQFIAPQGATSNLMDYADGTELWKHQWALISNPKSLWFKSWQEEEEGEMANIEKGIVVKEESYFVAPNKHMVKIPANAEVLYMCNYEEHLKNTGYLYKFKINGNVWESEGTMSSGDYLFDGYYSNGQKYSEEENIVKENDIVRIVHQGINYNTDYTAIESRELSIQKVRIKTTAYSHFYEQAETLGQQESVNALTSCGSTNGKAVDWDALKPDLEKLNQRLNTTWSVSIIDKEGTTHTLATGTKGAVQYIYNTQSKKWEAKVTGIPDEEVSKIVADAINKKLEAFQIDETGKAKVEKTTTTPLSTEDGGEFRFGDGLRWYKWGAVLADVGSSIWESSRLPETYWNQSNPKYKDYPLHTSPTFTGVADGVIEEITGVAQLVKLGVEVATDKEKAQALWNSIKNINLSSIKSAAVGAIKDKWDKYANSPSYITYHELGKDGVMVASMLYGGFATKGKKLADAVGESGDIIKKKADDILEETWQLSKQKLGRAADSKVLGDNLEAVGKVRPDNSAAHHIVAGGSAKAEDARKLLQDAGIDINEASNGVFLPKNSKYVIDGATSHANVHTKAYYDEIYNRLERTNAGKRREELQRIATELQNGTFPY